MLFRELVLHSQFLVQITFSSALTSSDSIDFIIALGDVLSVGTPTDGSVQPQRLQLRMQDSFLLLHQNLLVYTISGRWPSGIDNYTDDYAKITLYFMFHTIL